MRSIERDTKRGERHKIQLAVSEIACPRGVDGIQRIGRGRYISARNLNNGNGDANEDIKDNIPPVLRYGVFWRHDYVFWQSPARQRILGKESVGAKPVEVRDIGGIYILYDNEKPIYVGKSENIVRRLSEHNSDRLAGRWNRFSWFEISENVYQSKEAYEHVLIEALEPRLNRRSGDLSDSAREYIQERDKKIDKKNKERFLNELKSKLQDL